MTKSRGIYNITNHDEMIGKIYGQLKVLERLPNQDSSLGVKMRCQCIDCGKICEPRAYRLNNGSKNKCRCSLVLADGGSKHPLYGIWKSIRNRCYNEKYEGYKDYGGRGIKMCERWLNFDNFVEDVIEQPSEEHSIDRIDVNGDYEPGNWRWATPKEQANNRRNNRVVEYNGEKLTVSQCSEKFNIQLPTLTSRLNYGWTVEEALTTPVNKKDNKCQ